MDIYSIGHSQKEMLEEIKKHLKKHGFEEKGKTDEEITIFENTIKKRVVKIGEKTKNK